MLRLILDWGVDPLGSSTRLACWLSACTVAFALTGCGSKGPPVYEVRGQVLFNGKPVPHAFVVLHPVEKGRSAPRPNATTDESGNFVLSSFHAEDGAPAGEYVATVEWRKATVVRGEDPVLSANLLPVKYSKPTTSDLRVTIKPGSNENQILRVKG
jgi:hypothetical protein